jgi:hypothetical protein
MAALFPVFTVLHGPTSYNEEGRWLGVDGVGWGALMNGVPSLLIAAGLVGAGSSVVDTGGRAVRTGYVLVLVALVVPAGVDLVVRAIGAPLLMPVEAVGLLLVGLGRRAQPILSRRARGALVGIAALLTLAFASALVPTETSDQWQGARVFGVLAYLLTGIGWVAFGTLLARAQHRTLPSDQAIRFET